MTLQELLNFKHEELNNNPEEIIFSQKGINKDFIKAYTHTTTRSGINIDILLISYYERGNWEVIKLDYINNLETSFGLVSNLIELTNIIDKILAS